MIAKIEPAFSSMNTLERKVDYQLEKIISGYGKELYNSTGDVLDSLPEYMSLYANLNDRIKLPYSEITLNLSPGERLSDEDWVSLSKEYMEGMGYGDCCYSVILNTDKEHTHVHILHSRIDSEGQSVSKSFDYRKSENLVRDLERKYGLLSVNECDRARERLSSISGQRYVFDNALKKAVKNHAVKDRLMSVLVSSGVHEMLGDNFLKVKLNNEEWLSLLGTHDYDVVFSILKSGGFFKSLYKEELLSKLDRAYSLSKTFQDFRFHLQSEGVYMRLTSKKDKSYYVYGLPEDSFYIKDSSLPRKYRYGNMNFEMSEMSFDEQKHFIFNSLHVALGKSRTYDDFKSVLDDSGINLKEYINANGVFGLSFSIKGINMPFNIKASDISRKFTYTNLQNHFLNESLVNDNTIHRVGEWKEYIQRDNDYMIHSHVPHIPDIDMTGGSKKNREDDLPPVKRKKRQKQNDRSL